MVIHICPTCLKVVKEPGQMGRSFCYECLDYVIPTKLIRRNETMTFEEYIAILTKFMNENPESRHMQVADAHDELPSNPEIVEGNVVLADSF